MENQIQVIINCTKDLPNYFEPLVIGNPSNSLIRPILKKYFVKYYRVACNDNGSAASLTDFYRESEKIINRVVQYYTKGYRILVHCSAGQQRSCSFAQLLLCKVGHSQEQAFNMIIAARPHAWGGGCQINFPYKGSVPEA